MLAASLVGLLTMPLASCASWNWREAAEHWRDSLCRVYRNVDCLPEAPGQHNGAGSQGP